MFPVAALYAAALTALFIALALRAIRARRAGTVALGTDGDPRLLRASRAHANCAEYGPLGVLLLALAEGNGAGGLTHLAGAPLLIGRVLHAVGVSREPEDFRFRVAGMALTFVGLGAGATLALSWGLM